MCPTEYYPPAAVAAKIQGDTIVAVRIGDDGAVRQVSIIRTSGNDVLDQATVKRITGSWHYKPALLNGVPVETTKEYLVQWRWNWDQK